MNPVLWVIVGGTLGAALGAVVVAAAVVCWLGKMWRY